MRSMKKIFHLRNRSLKLCTIAFLLLVSFNSAVSQALPDKDYPATPKIAGSVDVAEGAAGIDFLRTETGQR